MEKKISQFVDGEPVQDILNDRSIPKATGNDRSRHELEVSNPASSAPESIPEKECF